MLFIKCECVKRINVAFYNCNIRRHVRVCFTEKLRLSSHKFLVERARRLKLTVLYTQRKCTLCNNNNIEDEYHVTLVCEYFRDVRKTYIKPFYGIFRYLI